MLAHVLWMLNVCFIHPCHAYQSTDNLPDRQKIRVRVNTIQEKVQGVQESLDISAIGKHSSTTQCFLRILTITIIESYYLRGEVQKLNTILSQLDEPINRSATQLSRVIDFLESESFLFQIMKTKSNNKLRVRTFETR